MSKRSIKEDTNYNSTEYTQVAKASMHLHQENRISGEVDINVRAIHRYINTQNLLLDPDYKSYVDLCKIKAIYNELFMNEPDATEDNTEMVAKLKNEQEGRALAQQEQSKKAWIIALDEAWNDQNYNDIVKYILKYSGVNGGLETFALNLTAEGKNSIIIELRNEFGVADIIAATILDEFFPRESDSKCRVNWDTVDYIVNHFIDNEFKDSYEIKSPDRYIPANRESAINIISESLLITHNITKWVIDKRFPATNSNQYMTEFEEEIVGVDTGFLDEDNPD